MRYVFIHGNHESGPLADQVTVEANIVVFTGLGNMYVSLARVGFTTESVDEVDSIYGNNTDNFSTKYHFSNGFCTKVDGQPNQFIPAREFTEPLLKSVSIPTLIIGELPT